MVPMAAASGLAQKFRIVFPAKVKVKNTTSSVYLRLYGILGGQLNSTSSVYLHLYGILGDQSTNYGRIGDIRLKV